MQEPKNSWEVSYIILRNRPNKQIGITFKEVVKAIGYTRCQQLNAWNSEYFTPRWFGEHI